MIGIQKYIAKKNKWSFEKEFRIHSFQFSCVDDERRKIVLPPEAFPEIYIGKYMSKKNKQEIFLAIKKAMPNIKIVYL